MDNDSKEPATSCEPGLAYLNRRFMDSMEARVLRIVAEYLEPQARFRKAGIRNTVVFFGSARILPREAAVENFRAAQKLSKNGASGKAAAALARARMAVQMARYYEEARELSRLITEWALNIRNGRQVIMVCSGGGPGIMEAANRGAAEAGGKSIGLNITLPFEQASNPYVPPKLNFLFRYFFMRKLWFAQPAKALVVFPGGFGTMDELWEFLNLLQTQKMNQDTTIMLYGSKFWNKAMNFKWLVQAGTVSKEDLQLIRWADTPEQAFEILKQSLSHDRAFRNILRRPFF